MTIQDMKDALQTPMEPTTKTVILLEWQMQFAHTLLKYWQVRVRLEQHLRNTWLAHKEAEAWHLRSR